MAKWIWTTGAALALFGVLSPRSVAKPGDLPVDITHECPECRAEMDHAAPRDGLAARPSAGADAAPQPRSGRWTDRKGTARPGQPMHHDGRRARLLSRDAPSTRDDVQAQQLFNLAEECRRLGDYAKARICYEEAHLLSPTSRCGRLAIDRLLGLDRERFGGPRGDAEEAEEVTPPGRREPPEQQRGKDTAPDAQRFRQMLESTVPLGGVPDAQLDVKAHGQWQPGWHFAGSRFGSFEEPADSAIPRKLFGLLIDVKELSLENLNGRNSGEASKLR